MSNGLSILKPFGERFQTAGPWIPAAFLLAFLVIPILALVLRGAGAEAIRTALGSQVVREALALSLVTSLATVFLAVSFGLPLAYLLSRRDFRGKALVESMVDLPLVLPPVVAGVAAAGRVWQDRARRSAPRCHRAFASASTPPRW